jgi:L-asparaginase
MSGLAALDRVLVLSLGGTIAMTPSKRGGVTPALSGADLVAPVPEVSGFAQITAEPFRQLPGAHLSFDDITALADRIVQEAAGGIGGVVVTQGTDTIEETAFLLDLLLDVEPPVVVTGAMRNAALPGADGPANLLASVQVAASERARGLGVLVVLNDEIHAARFVVKRHSTLPSAFASLAGPLGCVTEGEPRIPLSLPRWITLPRAVAKQAVVPLVTTYLDDGGEVLAAAAAAPIDGLVIEALGGGHVPASIVEPLADAAQRMPVVFTSRTGRGEALQRTYGFPGSETDLIERGLIPGGWLDGPKARVLLVAVLRAGFDAPAVRATFEGVAGP